MRIVAALGGNALLTRGEQPDAATEQRHIREAARSLAPLAAEHELVICHGNGPQVGLLAVESATDPLLSAPYPLDSLGAQTQGMIGYWLVQELHNAGVQGRIAALVTQTVVDEFDPAFRRPTKFVGPVYPRRQAIRLATRHRWTVSEDGGGWRRVVASPHPRRLVELPAVRSLIAAGVVTVCGGGGGAPVFENDSGQLIGVEAVIDKDLVAALMARELHADALLLLTDVDAVQRHFGTDHAERIDRITVRDLRGMSFPPGSMGPKIEACVRYVEATEGLAVIGQLRDAAEMLAGRAGTTIIASPVDARTGRYRGAPPA